MKLQQLHEQGPSPYFSMGMDAYDSEITDPEEQLPILSKLKGQKREDFLDGWHQAEFEHRTDDPSPRGGDRCPHCGALAESWDVDGKPFDLHGIEVTPDNFEQIKKHMVQQLGAQAPDKLKADMLAAENPEQLASIMVRAMGGSRGRGY